MHTSFASLFVYLKVFEINSESDTISDEMLITVMKLIKQVCFHISI